MVVLSIIIITISSLTFVACKKTQKSVLINSLYATEVEDPKLLANHSDLVIVGEFVKVDKAKRGVDSTRLKMEIVYTDNHVKVIQIVKNTTNNNIKIGDDVIVRLIGGTADGLTVIEDGEKEVLNEGKMVLFLGDGEKSLTLPKTPDKKYYSIMGGPSGTFYLSSDGIAKSERVEAPNKLNDLIEIVKSQQN
jgi:hypothetical protein